MIADDFATVFGSGIDVLLTPTAPTTARPLTSLALTKPIDSYADDVMTVAISLAGLPAVSVPFVDASATVANSAHSLPIGVQLVGRFGDDLNLLHVASFLE